MPYSEPTPHPSPPPGQWPPPGQAISSQPPVAPTPFVIRIEHRDVTSAGRFRPEAHVAFGAALRQCGLLHALPPECVRDILLLLSFVTPNGLIAPSVEQLAQSMRVSVGKARQRMERLNTLRWRGEPLLHHSQTQEGREFFSPLSRLASTKEDATVKRPDTSPPPIQAASREAIIAHSRQAYGRPREEVEREIEEQLGYMRDQNNRLQRIQGIPGRSVPGSRPQLAQPQPAPVVAEVEAVEEVKEPASQDASRSEEEHQAQQEREAVCAQLLQVGLLFEQAQALLEGFDLLSIRRQLMWLPYRKAKNPAGMLLAAVKDDYEAPLMRRAPVLEPVEPVAPSEPDGTDEPDSSALPGQGEPQARGPLVLEMPPEWREP